MNNLKELIPLVVKASLKAGQAILQVYESKFAVEHKDDRSPLTLADKNAHEVIEKLLAETGLPVLSEEGRNIPCQERKNWDYFWMVDPLDGTKEFVKRNGEFTVNIALIHQQKSVLGVIYVPVSKDLYFAASGHGAFKIKNCQYSMVGETTKVDELISLAQKLPVIEKNKKFTIVGSRSHLSPETEAYIAKLKAEQGELDFISIGSSLKICLVAEGKADVYPRFAPTMEWDIAAGQIIAEEAGRKVLNYKTGNSMLYNKENLLNDWFTVK